MREAIYEGERFDLYNHLSKQDSIKLEVDRLKKTADKGAFTCPYCKGILKLKAGKVYEKHFYHPSNSCSISEASETYQNQIKRETKSHSVMKEIIYDELKTQEKINDKLHVEYGYIEKADEKWKYYPDIIVGNSKTELAITILTDVTASKDTRLVKQIKKRNEYFKTKNLKPIWFVEETEQSVDMDRRVIHLWEAELDIAVKMEEDLKWEATLDHLETNKV
jgi:competence CoiA-like predicted nuclease